ncbi:MAG TPA: endonuclease/exonuclease/phosphatase family protein [Vicinamibacterales bacterium]|nr:endonuclease/exonuclease/phosphatase family protein [Vicinamibacterales bacterium]
MKRRFLLHAAAALAVSGAAACASLPWSRPQPIRVLVLNMHAGKDAKGADNLDGVARLIDAARPDIVLLQEVDRGTARSGNVDQIARLAEATGYAAAFAPSLVSYQGGQYGIAALARAFVGYHSTIPLAVTPVQTRAGGSREPRVALLAFVTVRGSSWRLVNTHVDPSDAAARAQELKQIADLARQQQAEGRPLVVGGDLNATPDDAGLEALRAAGLRDAWVECGTGDGFTYPADKPAKRIDYLWLAGSLHCASAAVIDSTISDHRPLLVTLK